MIFHLACEYFSKWVGWFFHQLTETCSGIKCCNSFWCEMNGFMNCVLNLKASCYLKMIIYWVCFTVIKNNQQHQYQTNQALKSTTCEFQLFRYIRSQVLWPIVYWKQRGSSTGTGPLWRGKLAGWSRRHPVIPKLSVPVTMSIGKSFGIPITDPWKWNIYLHVSWIYMNLW